MPNLIQNLEEMLGGAGSGLITESDINQASVLQHAHEHFGNGMMRVNAATNAKYLPNDPGSPTEISVMMGVGVERSLTFTFDMTQSIHPMAMGIIGDAYKFIESKKCHCNGVEDFAYPDMAGCSNYSNWKDQLCSLMPIVTNFSIHVTDANGNPAQNMDFKLYVESQNASSGHTMFEFDMLEMLDNNANHLNFTKKPFSMPWVWTGREGVMLGPLEQGYKYRIRLGFAGKMM